MTKKLYILGSGGHGKVVSDAARKMNKWEEIFFLDDLSVGKSILGISVKDKISNAVHYKQENTEFIVAIGNNKIRNNIHNSLVEKGCKIAIVIHPFTSIGQGVKIGQGTVIMAGVIINPSTKIGNSCIINTASSIDHDCSIGDFVHLSPGVRVAGFVEIGKNSWLGTNATVINNIFIGENILIGASGLVIKDILFSGEYIGVPVTKRKRE